MHHACILDVPYVFYVEATKKGILRVVLIEVAEAIRVAYRNLLIRIANDNLKWIYGDGGISGRTAMPEFTRDELGHVVDMHTLKQQLEVWDAVNAFYIDNQRQPFGSIKLIIPSLIAAWNASKGGVDVMSRYLANTHRSPFKRLAGFEFRLWDRLILLTYLQAFHVERWSAVDEQKIESAKSVEALIDLGHQEDRTFAGFLRKALRYFARLISELEQVEEPIEVEIAPYSGLKGDPRRAYFNDGIGKKLRSQANHHSRKTISTQLCALCQGRPYPDSKTPHGTRYQCIQVRKFVDPSYQFSRYIVFFRQVWRLFVRFCKRTSS